MRYKVSVLLLLFALMCGPSCCLVKSRISMLYDNQRIWRIYFSCDESDITDEDKEQLLNVIEFMQANPDKIIKIIGYTDRCCAPDNYKKKKHNLALSKKRASAVKEYIISCDDSLKYKIYTEFKGELEPEIVGNDEKAWSKNRRVVIIAY